MAFQKNTINVDERNVTLPVVYFYSEAGEPSVIDISVQNEHQDACPGLRLKEPVRFDGKLILGACQILPYQFYFQLITLKF